MDLVLNNQQGLICHKSKERNKQQLLAQSTRTAEYTECISAEEEDECPNGVGPVMLKL